MCVAFLVRVCAFSYRPLPVRSLRHLMGSKTRSCTPSHADPGPLPVLCGLVLAAGFTEGQHCQTPWSCLQALQQRLCPPDVEGTRGGLLARQPPAVSQGESALSKAHPRAPITYPASGDSSPSLGALQEVRDLVSAFHLWALQAQRRRGPAPGLPPSTPTGKETKHSSHLGKHQLRPAGTTAGFTTLCAAGLTQAAPWA